MSYLLSDLSSKTTSTTTQECISKKTRHVKSNSHEYATGEKDQNIFLSLHSVITHKRHFFKKCN